MNKISGQIIFNWAKDLFPLHRSITGQDLLKSLKYIKNRTPNFRINKVKTGTNIFDWVIPKEWSIKQAYIEEVNGKKIVDYKNNNLHVVGYSRPINKVISYETLKKSIYSLPKQKKAIPYLTSYYKKTWGFCLTENLKKKLDKKKKYKVLIDSNYKNGHLYFGEIVLKGKSSKEIVFSCNICHPSLANNELSGPVVAMAVAKYLKSLNRFYSYRIIFVPETIGALSFLKKNEKNLKNIKAGFVLSCLGDPGNFFSIINSRYANNYADLIAEANFKLNNYKYKKFSYLKRGSDERQYCSPKFNLPFCTLNKTRFGDFSEYHTSLDNLNYINSKSLYRSFGMIKNLINLLEKNKKEKYFLANIKGEPFFHKYNLKKSLSGFNNTKLYIKTKTLIDVFSYCDGNNSLSQISKIIKINIIDVRKAAKILKKLKILKEVNE